MRYLQPIIDCFNHPFFIIVGGFSTTIAIAAIIYRISCIILGISPLVFRIGKAVWKRKIAIVGSIESYALLKDSITETGLFKERNVIHIPTESIDKAKEQSILLIDWETSCTKIDEIFLVRKNHHTSVIIYAKAGSIPQEKMVEIANRTSTVVVNFKGRLLNDILNSLITTSFE